MYIYPQNTYCEALESYISEGKYEEIIERASKAMQKAFSDKRKHDVLKTPFENKVVGGLALLFVILFIICTSISLSNQYAESLLNVSIVFISLGLILNIWLSLYNFCRKDRKYISLDEFFSKHMNNLLTTVNHEMQSNRYQRFLQWSYLEEKRALMINLQEIPDKVKKVNISESNSSSQNEKINTHKKSKTAIGTKSKVEYVDDYEESINTSSRLKEKKIEEKIEKNSDNKSSHIEDSSFSITYNQKPVKLEDEKK